MKPKRPHRCLPTPDSFLADCPLRQIIDVIGNKWTLLVMLLLRPGVRRNGELKRAAQGISQKMLTQTLRDLERNGLVNRVVFDAVPPHVEYSLTRLGQSLGHALDDLGDWLTHNSDRVVAARGSAAIEVAHSVPRS